YPSFRRFLENKRSRVKKERSSQRKPGRTKLLLEALEHRLAPATVQDVLPAAIVTGQQSLTGAATNVNPQVAVDPVNPSKIYEVHSSGVFDGTIDTTKAPTGGIAGFYSNDGGSNFGSFNISNDSLPQFLLPAASAFTTVDPVSVAIDRNEKVYVAFSLHASD